MTQFILLNSARSTMKTKRNSKSFNIFWPAQSADLNPKELVCDELEQNVSAKQSTSTAHLWQLLLEIWAELSTVYLQSLVERMSRIFEAVIVTKGSILEN